MCSGGSGLRLPTAAAAAAADLHEHPISRTYQYRKVMKPMLERKRRARINRCLDELKELMVSALQAEGENVSKLEKADILELTVRHLHKLRRQHKLIINPNSATDNDRFRAGFSQCAREVSHFLGTSGQPDLLQHLGSCLGQIEPTTRTEDEDSLYTPPSSPAGHEWLKPCDPGQSPTSSINATLHVATVVNNPLTFVMITVINK